MEVIKICALQYNWIQQAKIGGDCKYGVNMFKIEINTNF